MLKKAVKSYLTKNKGSLSNKGLWWLLGIALATRILALGFKNTGFRYDVGTFKHWANLTYWKGFSNFYVSFWCDYPPGYIFVLRVLGYLSDLMHLQEESYVALLKMPAIICDIILAALVFNLAKQNFSRIKSLVIAALIALNPFIFLNSTYFGQIDSVYTLIVLVSMLNMFSGRYFSAALIFVLSALIKPQALLLCPVYLMAYVKKGDWRLILKCTLGGIALIFLIAVPFSSSWRTQSNLLLAFFKSLDIRWLFVNYFKTFISYPLATVNAFNFYFLHGANGVNVGQKFLFASYSNWGWAAVCASVLMVVPIFLNQAKKNDLRQAVFASSYFIISFLFVFGTQMHERYLYPACIFMLFWYIFSKDTKKLLIFIALSILHFLNVLEVFREKVSYNAYTVAIALLTTLTVIYSFKFLFAKNDKEKLTNAKSHSTGTMVEIFDNKITKHDWVMLLAITLAYSVLAFVNLGDINAPQTFYKAPESTQEFYIDLDEYHSIDAISYYYGVGDAKQSIRLYYSADGQHWTALPSNVELKSVFKWERLTFEPCVTRYICITCPPGNYFLGELGFYDKGTLLKVNNVQGEIANVFDEQSTVASIPSYMNSTYFDEIYHPRTAYEHLHLLKPYETTHPPLGKLIIALGIKLFGMSPFGWRVMGTLFGIFMLPLFYVFIKRVFGATKWAVVGTLLFALDFMHFSLTRMATIDSYPVFFIILSYYLMYEFLLNFSSHNSKFKNCLILFSGTGLAFGIGVATKWIAIYSGIGLLLLFINGLRNRKKISLKRFKFECTAICFCGVVFFVILPFSIYVASYIPMYLSADNSNLLAVMWKNQQFMLSYHGLLKATHSFSSKWWQWPLITKPLWAYQSYYNSIAQKDIISSIVIMGNPVLWWFGIFGVLYSLVLAIRQSLDVATNNKIWFFVVALFSQYLPWILVGRVVFIYHFFASIPFVIILTLFAIKQLIKNKKRHTPYFLLGICFVVFCMFYPILSGYPVPNWYVKDYLQWLPSWILM